ncbi:putative inorganic phosphate transporter 1-9 [Prunus yedoensis var. nudiflora]|uniref:Putative inorganic phosphate transporter 1-9 n=1 Tax=Prunus yedoensis var. nudiflora TaxID=2094558 RepID=A0A314Z0Y3_PRUYE|nr:putative inorganic phosphate transporter 1-9 [Prunus yedoensis var. nudiflora]
MALKVLSALDTARTQWYHFKAIIIAGMGLFSDAYDLFCIPPILRFLGRIYYQKPHLPFDNNDDNFVIRRHVDSVLLGVAFLGTVIGQLVFGRLGDRIGRRRVYGLSLMVMVLSALGCGFSICTSRSCVLVSLGFFRFLLGVGIGGDYPLSATIMSEFANKRTRGSFIAAVFSMQGFGILASSIVTMVVCGIFNAASHPNPKEKTPTEADVAWRLILMLGAIPAAMTYYWRMMMPETARYTALVELNVQQATKDMEKVLDVSLSPIAEDESLTLPQDPPSYPLFSKQFLRLHGRDLFGCSVVRKRQPNFFYSSNLFQSQVYRKYLGNKYNANVYKDAIHVALLQTIVAICSTIPGYWFTVYFIDRIGRRKIQMMGFMVLYGLTFFFANFGPNTTTFIVPTELFPARFRSTCHGISGATGKVGAIIGAVGFGWASHGQTEHPKAIKILLVILGGVCLLGLAVTYFFTPETNGRSLEENEE